MNLCAIEGVVSGLDRTTQVNGGGDTMTSTTHISIFNLSGERVLLKSSVPAMIADGDQLKVVGVRGQGQFTGVACKNLTTGWSTRFKRQGCAMLFFICFGLGGVLSAQVFPIFMFIPVVMIVVLFLIWRADTRLMKAQSMLEM